jgi:hypothetical protein
LTRIFMQRRPQGERPHLPHVAHSIGTARGFIHVAAGKRGEELPSGEDDRFVPWAAIGEDERDGLNVALNEATWAAISVDTTVRQARLLLDVLSFPAGGGTTGDSRVVVAVNQVGRVAASLRMGWWNDDAAEVIPLEVAGLDATVRSFGGCPIYGWQFIDPPEDSWSSWRGRLSLDARLGPGESPHVVDLFQEGGSAQPRHLDLRIWFTQIRITTLDDRDIPLPEFIASGVRWWDALYAGDARARGKGICPLRGQ